MFKLLNVYNTSHLVVQIERGDYKVEFDVSSILNKRNKVELDPENQFALLEGYLDYKGDEFKDKLMLAYVNASDRLLMTVTNPDIYPLPVSITYEILDMFDYYDVADWLINVRKVQPLPNLVEKFDTDDANDTEFTRAQTYLKSEYLELAALTLIVKAVIGPIGEYGFINGNEIMGLHKEYILYNFIDGHPISQTPPVLRLKAFVNKLVSISLKEATLTAVRVIEKRIPKEETADYVLAAIILQKVSIATIVNDNPSKNIITMIYTFINNKLSVKGDTSNSIRAKDGHIDVEVGEKESIVESYRMTVSVAPNIPIELNDSVSDINIIAMQMTELYGVTLDTGVIADAIEFFKIVLNGGMSEEQMNILTFIFKSVINPRGMLHLSIESVYNLLVVGFAYLQATDHKYLSLLLGSLANDVEEGVLQINSTVNRSRLPIEVKDKLTEYFPYEKVINKDTTANVAETDISKLANDIYGKTWNFICGEKYVSEVPGAKSGVPSDLKILLSRMVIDLEERRK